METLKQLAAAGWYFKILCDNTDGTRWRCWLSRRRGPLPHREECCECETVKQAVAWLKDTAAGWAG